MKRFANNGGEISRLTNEVVVFHAGARNANGIDFLKRVGADQMFRDLTGYYDDWRRIHVGVSDTGDGVGGAWTRRDEHHAYAPGRARIAFGHVYGALFVPYQVMSDSIAGAPQLVVDMKYCAARVTEDRVHAFMDQRRHEHLRAGWDISEQICRARCGRPVKKLTLGDHGSGDSSLTHCCL